MDLGKPKRKRIKRQLAPEEYTNVGHVTVDVAWRELSLEAFAIWIRIQDVSSDRSLFSGSKNIAKICDLSKYKVDRVLEELRVKGYIGLGTVRKKDKGRSVAVLRRLIVNSQTGFIRLG